MKKFFIILFCIFLFLDIDSKIAIADTDVLTSNSLKLDAKYYTEDGKIKIYSSWYGNDDLIITTEIRFIDKWIPKMKFYGADDKIIDGVITYPNYSEMSVGKFDLQWVFTPTQSDIYETKNGVFHFDILKTNDGLDDSETTTTEATTSPSLTATSLMLASTSSTYDINLSNKEIGSTYKWSSSNEKVAKVNSKGVVSAVNTGSCEITCAVTNSGNTQELKSTVTVGLDDDNLPILTEDDITLEIGDLVDVDVDNLQKGSKVKFVSSDKAVVKVTSTSGKITGLDYGKCIITCTITTPSKQVIVLQCNVEVSK